MRLRFLLFSLFLLPALLSSQEVDSLEQVSPDPVVVDSLEQGDVKVKSKFIPKPNRTLMWSLLPAGGQIYNRRWWKVPLVYGAFVGLGLAIDYNQNLYRDLRDAYLLALNDEPHQFSGTTIDSPNALRNLRDSFDKNTQTAYVGLVLLYALQSMEAYVDSHLRSFDVDDDLSFKIKPSVDVNGLTGQPVMGIGISIPLGR
ncbi:MAG: hypothetical protein KTR30_33320 [Saprospiraceae bacterium]|nr:hypothetical protein [Saprospiraceae bacterium]